MKNNSEYSKSKKLNLLVIALILLAVNLGCNFSCGNSAEINTEQVAEEANKLVREGNAIVEKANQAVTKADALSNELFSSENLQKVEDVEKYKDSNKAKFDELIKLREDVAKSLEEAATKFEQVSKMSVNDKFKEYNRLLAQQFKKSAEINRADAAFNKAYLAEKDPEKHSSMFLEFNKKDAEMRKEFSDLQGKAAKIKNDNPDVFKK